MKEVSISRSEHPILKFFRKIPLATVVVIVYVFISVCATAQCILGHLKSYGRSEKIYTNYNNYVIFKNSFFHLIQGKNLYVFYLNEQWDLYKYSPSFSFLFGSFAYLPDFIGLFFWNLLNVLPVLIGVKYLKGISNRNKYYALLFCVIELLGNLQNSQSNGLMAGLIILTFISLENEKYFFASLFVVFSVYLKIYGGIAFVLFIFYPAKPKLFFYTLFWFIVIGLLPLISISWNQLIYLYHRWGELLKTDQELSIGISVSGILYTWFNWQVSRTMISLIGIIVFLLPLCRIQQFKYSAFRLSVLCSMLVWVVIFNHKAESPTYIIALLGVAIWYFSQPKTVVNFGLLILTLVLTTFSVSDLTPRFIRNGFVNPYGIKAVMPIVVWCKIMVELYFKNYGEVGKKYPGISNPMASGLVSH